MHTQLTTPRSICHASFSPRAIRRTALAVVSLIALCIAFDPGFGFAQDQRKSAGLVQRAQQARRASTQLAQQAKLAKQAQSKAVRVKIDEKLPSRTAKPQPWKSNRPALNESATLVIGSPMPHVNRYVKGKNAAGGNSQYVTYQGVPQGLKTRIERRAEQRGAAAFKQALAAADKRGMPLELAKLNARKAAELTAKHYRDSRYLKHNLAFIRYAAKSKITIVDIGTGPGATGLSPFLRGERSEVRKLMMNGKLSKFRVDYSSVHLVPRTWPPAKN